MLYATHAVVDLAAIRANLAGVRERVGDRAILAAVKANAYGHGAVEVSGMLERTGAADWLGVATVPEGLELRAAGIRLPILKLSHAFADEIEPALRADLTLTVVDAETIDEVRAVTSRLGLTVPVHLKLDTGMRRIGSEPSEAVALARRIAEAANLTLDGLFTHLPISDTPEGDAFTRDQLARFVGVAREVTATVGPVRWVHASNSGGILAHSLEGLTMVRPGIMIYGYYPDPETPHTIPLRQALTLKSRVAYLKRINAGETVGYGRSWTAESDTWIATVPVGYADGYSRLNSNRGRMLIGGVSYPVAGRVCMDQTMLDLGPSEPTVVVGDEVVLLGCQGDACITTDEMADLMGTITYEVTCLLTPRVQRVYVD
ncbi:MAG TPA: alanine racemase [Propionibacteriaceae bacterium]|nr:alanine racemase [Propionibacteriaceae bacterium]